MKIKLIWINFALCLLICLEAYMIVRVWTEPGPGNSSSFSEDGEKMVLNHRTFKVKKRIEMDNPDIDYASVVEKNLFSEFRREFIPDVEPEQKVEKKEEKEPIQKEPEVWDNKAITLYGVMMIGDYRKALIKDVSDRETPLKWVQEGDELSKFSVHRIENDRIVIVEAGKDHTLLLYDKKKPKKRRPVQVPRSQVQRRKSKTKAKKSGGAVKTPGEEDKYEIIKTPFGEFKRKIN